MMPNGLTETEFGYACWVITVLGICGLILVGVVVDCICNTISAIYRAE